MSRTRRIDSSDCVGVIPARWGSTRFPGKSLIAIAGQSLLARVIAGSKRAKRVKHWIVATDDPRIARVALESGVEVIMTPTWLKSGSDRVALVARRTDAKWIINWQGDEWTAAGRPIDILVETLEAHPECPVATLARPIDKPSAKNPNRVKVVLSTSGHALYFSRAPIPCCSEGNEPHLLHLGAYAFERALLLRFAKWHKTPLERCERLEQLRLLEHDVPIAVGICRAQTFGVDTPRDARELARYIRSGRSNR